MSSVPQQRPWLAGPEPHGPRQVFFSFQGRIGRKTWWLYGVLAMLGLSVLGTALLRIAGLGERGAEFAVNVLLLWPAIAVSVKRWHDRGKSAWWVLIWLIPVIGWLWVVLENGFLPGTRGDNAYGPPEVA
jgi:uncharacterized membrane protein YhaH (DUF805 family)